VASTRKAVLKALWGKWGGERLGNHELHRLVIVFKRSEYRFVNDKRGFEVAIKLKNRFVFVLYDRICTTPGHQYNYDECKVVPVLQRNIFPNLFECSQSSLRMKCW